MGASTGPSGSAWMAARRTRGTSTSAAHSRPSQGGVVAGGWLKGKYITQPRWQGGDSAEAAVAAEWAAGEGAELLRELKHEVTEPGYQPPLVPAAMGL